MPLKDIIYVSLKWLRFLNDSHPLCNTHQTHISRFLSSAGPCCPGSLAALTWKKALGTDKEDLCLSLSPVIKHTSLRDLFCIMGIIILHLFTS